jgi:bifunctional DNA-binding transcriptional regulator/antitoxin component of YhaV-PrlF toxin-antitoxin module
MNYIATITSKRQLTIPAQVFTKMKLLEGEKVHITIDKNQIKISRFGNLLDNLAGRVAIPKRYKGFTSDEMVKKAKNEHMKV